MPDGDWEPVDPSRVGTPSGRRSPGDIGASGRVARSPRGGRAAAGAAALVVAAVAWAVVGRDGGTGDDRSDDATGEIRERTDEERAAEAAEGSETADARRAFAQASRRLQEAGSYTYTGAVHAPEASDARPAQAPAPEVAVNGQVLWPLRTHEIALGAAGQIAETITVGPSIWQRQASGPERLDAEPYVFAGDVATWGGGAAPSGAGAARLPSWLAATTERTFQSERSGRSTFAATLPAERFGTVQEGAPAVDGTVELTVDADGVPLRIEVETADDETGDDPAWRLAVDIGGLGDPVVIDLPNGELAAVTEGPSPADVRAAGIAAPVELAQLPDEWMLAVIMLRDDPGAGCASLELSYGAIGPTLAGFLTLQVMPPQCATPAGPDRPLHAGAFSGEARLFSEGGGGGALTDGRTAIEYISDLPTEEVLRLLETLEPYDPTTRPTALAAASARG